MDIFGSARARELFAQRFEADGDGYIFRRNLRAAPVRISAAERDEAVNAFGWSYWWLFGGLLIAIVLLVVSLVLLNPTDEPVGDGPLYAGLAIIIALFVLVWMRVWSAPARRFSHKAVAGPERSRAEARKMGLAQISWSNLALVPVMAVIVIYKGFNRTDPNVGWGRLWLVTGGGLVLLAAIQAIRKWRAEREDL